MSAIIGVMGLNDACKAKKETTATAQTQSNKNNPVCTMRIEFYSIGSGTDYSSIEKLNKYLETKKIPFEAKPWGREGEVTYCLKFSDKKAAEIKNVKEEVKKMLANSQFTRIEEDTPLTR